MLVSSPITCCSCILLQVSTETSSSPSTIPFGVKCCCRLLPSTIFQAYGSPTILPLVKVLGSGFIYYNPTYNFIQISSKVNLYFHQCTVGPSLVNYSRVGGEASQLRMPEKTKLP